MLLAARGAGGQPGVSQGCSGHLWDQGTRWSPPAGHCSAWCDPKSDFASPLLRGEGDAGRQEEGSSPLVLPRPGRESPKSVPALPPSVPSAKCRQHRCSASSGLRAAGKRGSCRLPAGMHRHPSFSSQAAGIQPNCCLSSRSSKLGRKERAFPGGFCLILKGFGVEMGKDWEMHRSAAAHPGAWALLGTWAQGHCHDIQFSQCLQPSKAGSQASGSCFESTWGT